MRSLTLKQVRQLLDVAKSHRVEALFVMALATGTRLGELLALKWSEVDLTEGLIHVQRSPRELKGGIIESKPKSSRG